MNLLKLSFTIIAILILSSCGRDTKTMENRIVGHWIEKEGETIKSHLYFGKIEDNGTGYVHYKTSDVSKHKFKIVKVDETLGYLTLAVESNPFYDNSNETVNTAFYISSNNKRLTFRTQKEERTFVYEDSKTEP